MLENPVCWLQSLDKPKLLTTCLQQLTQIYDNKEVTLVDIPWLVEGTAELV